MQPPPPCEHGLHSAVPAFCKKKGRLSWILEKGINSLFATIYTCNNMYVSLPIHRRNILITRQQETNGTKRECARRISSSFEDK